MDVCLISETHFTRESYTNCEDLRFNTTHIPATASGLESAVIIETGISHHEDIKIEKEKFQATSVKLKTTSGLLTVTAIYSPPRHNLKREDYLSLLQNFTAKFIIVQDFNSKNTYWGSRLTKTKGSELYHAIRKYYCDVHTTGKPTYWPTETNKLPELIDYFVSKNLSSSFIVVTEEFDLDSDHLPIVLTLSGTIIKKGPNPTLLNHPTDWDMFRETSVNRINLRVALTITDELEDDVQKFVTDIQHSAWEATPLLTTRVKGNTYPHEVCEKIAEESKVMKKWQMTRDPRIKIELNRIIQDLRRAILQIKQLSTEAYLQDLTDDASTDYSLWKATKRLKRPTMNIPTVRKQDHTWTRNNKEKAEAFADHLERTFQTNEEKTMDSPRRIEETRLKRYLR
jgi:hypothetical protein